MRTQAVCGFSFVLHIPKCLSSASIRYLMPGLWETVFNKGRAILVVLLYRSATCNYAKEQLLSGEIEREESNYT